MGAQEIAKRLGLSRQRVQQLIALDSFPAPFDVLAMGRLWRREDVERWILACRPELADGPKPRRSGVKEPGQGKASGSARRAKRPPSG